jgi:uncharacterized integral membrane protein (TIGR00698 family)
MQPECICLFDYTLAWVLVFPLLLLIRVVSAPVAKQDWRNRFLEPKIENSKDSSKQHATFKRVAFIFLLLACLLPVATPAIALALGAAFALLLENPFPGASKKASKKLLQICVVLLGFQMDFSQLVRVGASGWVFAAFTIAATFGLGALAGRWLKLHLKTSLLISAGTAICGGSAIAAVGPVINAAESEMAMAIGTVFVLNAVALYLFPVIGHLLHLGPAQFGIWSGIAIHDISSVVGAASAYGDSALQIATATKLSRTLWIVPVTLAVAYFYGRRDAAREDQAEKPGVAIPWFIGLFILASLARMLVPAIFPWVPAVSIAARTGLTVTLFLVGAGMSRATLRATGWKAFAQGVFLWLFISLTSLAVVHSL